MFFIWGNIKQSTWHSYGNYENYVQFFFIPLIEKGLVKKSYHFYFHEKIPIYKIFKLKGNEKLKQTKTKQRTYKDEKNFYIWWKENWNLI